MARECRCSIGGVSSRNLRGLLLGLLLGHELRPWPVHGQRLGLQLRWLGSHCESMRCVFAVRVSEKSEEN